MIRLGKTAAMTLLVMAASVNAIEGEHQTPVHKSSAPVLLLDDAIKTALGRNLELDSAFKRTEQAKDQVDATKTHSYPRLGFKAGARDHLTDQHFTLEEGTLGDYPPIGPIPSQNVDISTNFGVVGFTEASISQPLTKLYTYAIAVDHSKAMQLQSDADFNRTRQSIIQQVKQTYYNILRTEGDLHSVHESITFLTELSRVTDNYVKQGEAYAYQALEVDSRLARQKHNAQVLNNRVVAEKQRLNHLMDRDLDTPFQVKPLPLKNIELPDMDVLANTAIKNNASVAEARYGVEAAKLAYKSKQSEYIPDVALTASYLKLYEVEFIPDEEAYIGIEMAWDIYDWGRKGSESSARKSKIYTAENRLQDTKSRILIELDRSYRQLQDAKNLIQVTALSEKASKSKLDVQWNRYKQQEALLDDVLKAQSELERARADHNRAILGAYSAQADVEKLLGGG